MVALGLTAFLGLVSFGVDMGAMLTARTESQRVADASALAGAGGLATNGTAALAQQLATSYGAQNSVRNNPVTLIPSDIVVDLNAMTVRVTVHHTIARGNPIPTFFMRVFGVSSVDVVTVATAQASEAAGLNCVLPLAMPDRWLELGGNPAYYDAGIDQYVPFDPVNPLAFHTGYSHNDVGTLITIVPFQGGGVANTSWYYPWRPPGQQGGADYRTNINSCVDPSLAYYIGQVVPTEPGAMIGPTLQGFGDLINQDPGAGFNSVMNCVTDLSAVGSSNPAECRASPRVRPMPMFDPTVTPVPGVKPFTFTNFVAVFVSHIQGNAVYAYFVGYTGVAPAGGGAATTAGPQFKYIHLIE